MLLHGDLDALGTTNQTTHCHTHALVRRSNNARYATCSCCCSSCWRTSCPCSPSPGSPGSPAAAAAARPVPNLKRDENNMLHVGTRARWEPGNTWPKIQQDTCDSVWVCVMRVVSTCRVCACVTVCVCVRSPVPCVGPYIKQPTYRDSLTYMCSRFVPLWAQQLWGRDAAWSPVTGLLYAAACLSLSCQVGRAYLARLAWHSACSQ